MRCLCIHPSDASGLDPENDVSVLGVREVGEDSVTHLWSVFHPKEALYPGPTQTLAAVRAVAITGVSVSHPHLTVSNIATLGWGLLSA